MMGLVRPGKGPALAAGAVLAAVDSERGHWLEPANGKAEGKAGRDAARVVVVKARAAVRSVAKQAAVEQESQVEKGETTMPGGDGTGPMGMGPMTGRAAGFCAGYGVPGYMNPVSGRGFGMGFGRGRGFGGRGFGGSGRGWRNMFYATGLPGWARAAYGMPAWSFAPVAAPYTPSPQQETDALKRQAEFLEQQLEEIRRRLSDLETEKAEK